MQRDLSLQNAWARAEAKGTKWELMAKGSNMESKLQANVIRGDRGINFGIKIAIHIFRVAREIQFGIEIGAQLGIKTRGDDSPIKHATKLGLNIWCLARGIKMWINTESANVALIMKSTSWANF